MLRPKLNRVWSSANAVTRRDPGDTKYITGWVSEIPTYQVLNYLQYKIDTTLLSLAERGVFEWGTDVQYGLNSLVWDETNKKIYVSTVGSPNRNLAPSANLSQWAESSIQVSRASYDAVVAAINAHIADVTGNPHKLTAGRLGAYNKDEIDNIVAQYRAIVKAHVDDRNNPHQVTATQVGAVPVTGGTYTGDVIFNAGVWFDAGKVNGIVKDSGLWMQNGAGRIGINSSGVGYVGVSGLASPIVTEASYPNLKAAQEPNYAAPMPILQMGLINSINIDSGFGYVDSNFNPVYSAVTGALQLANSPSVQQVLTGNVGLTQSSKLTIAFDVYAVNARVSEDTTTNLLVGFANTTGGDSVHLLLTGSSRIKAERYRASTGTYDTALYQLTGPIQTWYRVVATFDGNVIKLFVDGVEVATKTDATGTATIDGNKTARLSCAVRTAAQSRTFNIRNIRFWGEALTPKQVSTL